MNKRNKKRPIMFILHYVTKKRKKTCTQCIMQLHSLRINFRYQQIIIFEIKRVTDEDSLHRCQSVSLPGSLLTQ